MDLEASRCNEILRDWEIARIKKPEVHRAWDLGLGTWDLGLGTWGLGLGTWDLGLGTWDLGWKTSVYEINDILERVAVEQRVSVLWIFAYIILIGPLCDKDSTVSCHGFHFKTPGRGGLRLALFTFDVAFNLWIIDGFTFDHALVDFLEGITFTC